MSDKAKAMGISAGSFLDLKAELSKRQGDFARNKAAGKSSYVVGGVKRPDKKPTVWARQNKGVNNRALRDLELEAISKPTLESARAALERKAKIYDKLKKGQTGGLSDKQYDALLVDFDSKPSERYESDSDDVDESLTLPTAPEDDPMVEYEDEFGRLRTARRSEVPRDLAPSENKEDYDSDEDLIIIGNPVGHFPVYQPSAERVAQIEKEHAEENNPLGVHYDATGENRAKGAGFYQFSADELTRKAQMDELKAARVETEKTRKDTGAMEILPGESEGMQDASSSSRSRTMEKRKREIEERRKLLDAKRRKVGQDALPVTPPVAAPDPFAALESGSSTSKPPKTAADAFLDQLQNDFLNGKRK
ncbi:hypothetical protein MIND_00244300 [Mycena indigotica]|uniref:Uncharacterized protein n=1 Tax=Mycena indigotica TaxID=2126181 RepID=A0A8H6T5S8_9AGAR|nr:uncharacterized protein MIND_00244300 [Mycena indigotica]KAF7312313.1 hypothetical protein MIND_00244300 [Mycena indigotica]